MEAVPKEAIVNLIKAGLISVSKSLAMLSRDKMKKILINNAKLFYLEIVESANQVFHFAIVKTCFRLRMKLLLGALTCNNGFNCPMEASYSCMFGIQEGRRGLEL